MTVELEKKFRFESAHRLVKGYQGKCNNIHGHSWNGKIVVLCNKLDEFDMGVDYADLKRVLRPLEDELDHKLILWEGDSLVDELKDKTQLVLLKKNPTSEVIATYIFWYVHDKLIKLKINCTLLEVQIEETCTTKCTYRGC